MAHDRSAHEQDVAAMGSIEPSSQSDEQLPKGTLPAVEVTVGSRRGAFTGGLWSAASAVLPMAGTLALSVTISRQLGADVLGQQSLVAYVSSTLVSILIYSFTVASVQVLATANGAGDGVGAVWLERWAFGAHLLGGTVTAGAMVGIGLVRAELGPLWFLAAATALADALGWAYASRDIARRGWAPTASRRLVAQGLSPLAAIAAIFLGFGIYGVFAAQLVVSLVLLEVMRRLAARGTGVQRAGTTPPPWRPAMKLWSLFTLSILISQVVDRRLEIVFLDWFHSAETVALYSVSFSVVGIATTLTGALIGAASPAIANRNASDPLSVAPALSRAARVVVAVALVLAAGLVTVGPGLVEAAYGPSFDEAGNLVRWLGATMLFLPLSQLYGTLWSGRGQLRPVLIAGGVGAVVDIVLALSLIPAMAATGAVIASVSAQGVSAAIITVYTIRSGLRLELRFRRLLGAIGVALLAGGAAVATTAFVDGSTGDLLAVGAFAVAAAVGTRLIGLFDPEDLEWLAGTVPGPAARVLTSLSPRSAPTR